MVKSIVIRGADLVPDEYNDTYRYRFPAGQMTFKGHSIAVGSVSMYNSFYNISSTLKNNTFSYYWSNISVSADTTSTSNVLENVTSLANIVAGQYLVGTGIPKNTTVVSVDGSNPLNLKINMSQAATASATVSVEIITVSTITANTVNGSAILTNVSSTTSLFVGMLVYGVGIPAGASILSIDSDTQITLSAAATANGTAVTISYPTPISVTIPDGQYTVQQLNTFLQFTFIQNTHYLVDGSGNYVYFYEILWNPTKDIVELVSYPIPTALGTYTLPVGATWSLPAVTTTPQLLLTRSSVYNEFTFLTTYFGLGYLLGFATGIYPPAPQTSVYNVLADYPDEVYSINAISLACNMLSNNLSIPQSLLYSLPINDVGFGEAIVDKQGSYAFVPILDGVYPDIIIRFYDQNGNRLRVRDTDIVVYLLIKAPDDPLSLNQMR